MKIALLVWNNCAGGVHPLVHTAEKLKQLRIKKNIDTDAMAALLRIV